MTTQVLPRSWLSSFALEINWTLLEADAEVQIGADVRTKITDAMTDYAARRDRHLAGARGAALTPILKKIGKAAAALSEALHVPPSADEKEPLERLAANAICTAASRSTAGGRGFTDGKKLHQLRGDAIWLAEFAGAAIEGLKGDLGAPGNPDLDRLIRQLAEIMKATGWAGPQSDAGLHFMWSACVIVGASGDKVSKDTIRGRVETALKKVSTK